MATPHINAKMGDFANVVIMPGDPVRAKWIADTYLHDVVCVNEVRGMLAFTGLTNNNNKRISVMASGMGCASIGIYSHELYESFGVDLIIRVGTCGSYQPEINLFDVIIATAASTDSNWAGQFELLGGTYAPSCDLEVAGLAAKIAEKRNQPVWAGTVLSADVFYDIVPDYWKRWARLGVLAVEMESYALYANANIFKKKALCLLSVTDNFNRKQNASSEERVKSLGKMLELAIETAEEYAK